MRRSARGPTMMARVMSGTWICGVRGDYYVVVHGSGIRCGRVGIVKVLVLRCRSRATAFLFVGGD